MPHYQVVVDEKEYDVQIEGTAGCYETVVNGRRHDISSQHLNETRSLLLIDGRSLEVDVTSDGATRNKIVFMRGMEIPVEVDDYHLAQLRKQAGIASGPAVDRVLKAPMPGLVLQVKVSPGDSVKKGQALLVVEAMKMENVVKATGDATVKAVKVSSGSSVERGDAIIEFD